MKKELQVGMQGQSEMVVEPRQLASVVGSGEVEVLATPMMIAGIEATAAASVKEALDEGMTSVGTLMNVTHVAATPLGMKVRFETELTAISPNGRGLTFHVRALDEAGLIGEGTHERVIVNRAKFESRAKAKKAN